MTSIVRRQGCLHLLGRAERRAGLCRAAVLSSSKWRFCALARAGVLDARSLSDTFAPGRRQLTGSSQYTNISVTCADNNGGIPCNDCLCQAAGSRLEHHQRC